MVHNFALIIRQECFLIREIISFKEFDNCSERNKRTVKCSFTI